jgi:hypothetical protein
MFEASRLKMLRNKSIRVSITLIIILMTISSSGIIFKDDYKTKNLRKLQISSTINNSTQWIKNPSFDFFMEYWNPSYTGDLSDVDASINSGQANFEILGEKRIFSFIADPPLAVDWKEMSNPSLPDHPDNCTITSEGCRVSHVFNDITAVQQPSVHWDHNISMFDMSDYIIKSASIQAIVNATVDENLDRLEDYLTGDLARTDPDYIVDTYSIGDFIKYYILVSDLEKNRVYEIAHFQTEQIGSSNPPGKDYLYDTYMLSVPQEDLIFALTSVLSSNNFNFTLTLGITLHIEDNIASYWDLDSFDEIYMKYVNLTFTLEKKIDRYTSVSWNQIGKPISEENTKIVDASLEFKYKVDDIWSESLSPNSELKVFINNHEIEKRIKLKEINTTLQTINIGSNYIKPYIFLNYNISISVQLLIADDFELDRVFTFSIDDIYLNISYNIFIEEPFPYYIIWIILSIAFIIIAILSILSLRSYILMPRKLKKRTALLARTQRFKDVDNIQGILLIHSESGLPLFSRNYSEFMEDKNALFSGFIQAVSIVGEEISNRKNVKSTKFQSDVIDGTHKIIELDFKHFYCLSSDIEELRTVLILRNKASKRLKKQMLNFGLSVYARFSETLRNWNHELNTFHDEIPNFLKNYFNLDYKDFFKLNLENFELERIKREFKLSKEDYKTLIDIISISEQTNNIFKLISLLKKLSHKSEDLIIDTIEVLIKKNLIVPVNSSDFQV